MFYLFTYKCAEGFQQSRLIQAINGKQAWDIFDATVMDVAGCVAMTNQ